nr:IS3 family transposase [Fusobacterium varium]
MLRKNNSCFGYRRIYIILLKIEIKISEKIVYKIMKEEKLLVKVKKTRKYNSYRGEISPKISNLLNRNFQADKPNKKWVTDITKFSILVSKIYLSQIIDCFDGKIGEVPDSKLANTILKATIVQLKENEHPILHMDRGYHYSWKEWRHLLSISKIVSSMSKKECSPDNSACEGLKMKCFLQEDGQISI